MASLNSVKLGSGSLLTYFSSSSLSSKQLDQIGKRKHKTLAENVISFISQLGLQKSRQRVVPTPSKSCQPSVGVLPCVLSPCVRGTVEKLWRCNCIDQWSEMVCSLLNWNGVVRKNFWWNKQQGTKRIKKIKDEKAYSSSQKSCWCRVAPRHCWWQRGAARMASAEQQPQHPAVNLGL